MVSLHIGHFGVSLSEQSCDKFSIEVFDGNSSDAASLGKFCGNGMPGTVLYSMHTATYSSCSLGKEEAGLEIKAPLWCLGFGEGAVTCRHFEGVSLAACDPIRGRGILYVIEGGGLAVAANTVKP